MLTNPISSLCGLETETRSPQPRARPRPVRVLRAVQVVLLLVAAGFFALHFVHLRADFPNHSPWMDWAKYTDEGWYGDAAIRHYQLGHWYVPGDFNPAAALPVWPAIEIVLFRFTGVSLVAVRALTVVVFGLIMVCGFVLVQRWSPGGGRNEPSPALAPATAALLLAVSPFLFAFMRLAILEPLLILLTLAALLAASAAGKAGAAWADNGFACKLRERLSPRPVAWVVALGFLLPLMVLTKTTGVFLFPAIFWLLWAASGYRLKPFLAVAAASCGIGAAVWVAYFGLFVRPRYLSDYRYLFSANAYTGVTLKTLGSVLQDAFTDGAWIGKTLSWLALAAMVAALAGWCFKRTRGGPLGSPLIVSLLLWIFGYGAFLAYHANLQPRYYLVLAVPVTLLVAIVFDALLGAALGAMGSAFGVWVLRGAAVVGGAAMIFAAVNPEETWDNAAARIDAAIEGELAVHSGHSRRVLSISGSDLSLMTGLPSICDDFGTLTLSDRVALYKPGWFATWNDVEDDKMEALDPMYRLVRVAAIPAFDDPERNLLILYRLDPVGLPGPAGRPGRRRSLSVPQRLKSKVGEQPNPVQLEH
jgi:hypothetical protein